MLSGVENKTDRKKNDELFLDFLNVLDRIHSIIYKEFDENNFLELVVA
jgi:hypothetical protein